jgi:hypothetical protein
MLKHRAKIKTASFEAIANLSDQLLKNNSEVSKKKIDERLTDYLLQEGDKAFCKLYNQAVVDGKKKEILNKLNLT